MESFLNYSEIGKRIRLARLGKKWTQAKLAEAVGCSTANITNIEKAKTKLSLSMFVRITQALEICAEETVGTRNSAVADAYSSIETDVRTICAGLSPEDAQTCRRACTDFCAAFSRHFARG